MYRTNELVGQGRIQNFFARGGQRGGALIIMVWAWLRNIARKRDDVPGVWASPQPLFTVIMLLRRVFVVFVCSGRRKTPPLVAMNI